MKRLTTAVLATVTLAMMASATVAMAQEHGAAGGLSEAELTKANNPLADSNAFNIQDYYGSSLYGLPDQTSNSLLLRGVMVSGRQIIRATLPVSTIPTSATETTSGLGDLNVFDSIVLTPDGASTQLGLGPLFVFPTASNDSLGQGKFQLGLAGVGVRPLSEGSLLAALVTWQASVAGDDNRENTNFLTAQPFLIFQVGGGVYVRSSGLWTFDIENNRRLIPFGLGAGKVFRSGNAVVNVFAEPQFTVYHKGDGQPAFQVFTGINLQWAKRK